MNRYGPVNHLYGLLRRPLTLLQTTTDLSRPLYGNPLPFCKPLRTRQLPLRTTTRPLPPDTYYIILHSMADIRKQVSEGQRKWSQGVDLTSTTDVNNYINFKILEYGHHKLLNDDLWEQYKEDFADFTEAIFKACSLITIRKL